METDTQHSTEPHTDQPGPKILEERSLLGIFVHLIALLTGVVGAGVIYLATDHDFTRANAKRALNWHLLLSIIFTVGLVAFVVGLTLEWLGIPDPVLLVPLIVAIVSIALSSIMMLATFLFVIVATIMAIFGSAWWYPAPDIVARLARLVE